LFAISSLPHGRLPLVSLSFSVLALILAFIAANSCYYLESNFVYCKEPDTPELPYAFCGDCHCIQDDFREECPALPPAVVDFERLTSESTLNQYKALGLTNPYSLLCNPYNTTNCTTTPPQLYTDLGTAAVCAYKYETSDPRTECTELYSMETYESKEAMLQADADDPSTTTVLTHWGSCGACSTAQDFAAYLEFPDLASIGTACQTKGILNSFDAAVSCYMDIGFTEACAVIWVHNGFYTGEKCGPVCVKRTVSGFPNNSPAPTCRLQDCLQCDEDMSGPIFQKVAGRSRRRSGLLSMIARPCDSILAVEHVLPCEAPSDADVVVRNRNEFWKPPPPEKICTYAKLNLGIFSFEQFAAKKGLFNIDFALAIFDNDEYSIFKSSYSVCKSYNINRSVAGFWKEIENILGAAWSTAKIFTIVTLIAGGVCCVIVGCSSCVAYRPRVWKSVGGVFLCCSTMMFLTLVFFSSGVCEDGCQVGRDAILAIVSGACWLVAGVFALLVPPVDEGSPIVSCCCCPAPIDYDMKQAKSLHCSEEVAPLMSNDSFHSAQDNNQDNDVNNTTTHSSNDGEQEKGSDDREA